MSHIVRWNVRNRFMVAFVLVAVIPLVVFGALVYSRTAKSLHEVERGEIVAQATGAREVLRQHVSEERAFIHDYSIWDEFHAAMLHGDPGWIRNNITDWVPANSATNMVVLFDKAGKIVARGGDRVSGPLWASGLVQAARRGEIGSDLSSLNGRLYVLAAAPVVAQTYPSRPAGVLVFGQAVTDSVLESVNRFTGGRGGLSVYTGSTVSTRQGRCSRRVGSPAS
jgi:sensor domain CHASE-containing protein